jgi:hypothetical protein
MLVPAILAPDLLVEDADVIFMHQLLARIALPPESLDAHLAIEGLIEFLEFIFRKGVSALGAFCFCHSAASVEETKQPWRALACNFTMILFNMPVSNLGALYGFKRNDLAPSASWNGSDLEKGKPYMVSPKYGMGLNKIVKLN